MIRRLRIRVVFITMLSLLMVLAIFVSAINLFNLNRVVSEADRLLDIISEFGGRLPDTAEIAAGQTLPDYSSPEEPYENRYFSVLLDSQGNPISVNTDEIAAVDAVSAVSYAQNVLESGRQRGFVGDYRFVVQDEGNGVRCSFVDWGRRMETVRSFVFISLWVSLAVMVGVLILVSVLSQRIVEPVAESYAKQKRFITDAGHEIKTPLAIIDADASLIEMEGGPNKWVDDIQVQVKRLAGLTNDLTYLARMEEEDRRLQIIDFPITDVVEELAKSFEGLALAQKKHFTSSIEPGLSMKGDEHAIRQLVSILLDNAVKYCDEEGDIRITLARRGRFLHLEVFNTTTGSIAKEDLKRLFDRFYRTDESRSLNTGGYGIGLSIASAVVSAHKGKISATSKDGKSLTITAVIPG